MLGIIHSLGVGLLILSGGSALALFIKAVASRDSSSEGIGKGTLWGLFIIGLIAGLILVAAGR